MRKYRKQFLIFFILVLGYLTGRSIYHVSIGYDKGMSMIGIIAYGVGLIIYSFNLYDLLKNKKRINS